MIHVAVRLDRHVLATALACLFERIGVHGDLLGLTDVDLRRVEEEERCDSVKETACVESQIEKEREILDDKMQKHK